MKDVLEVCEKPLVSLDFKGSFVSSSIDASLTMVMGDDMVKVVAWCVLRYNSQGLVSTACNCTTLSVRMSLAVRVEQASVMGRSSALLRAQAPNASCDCNCSSSLWRSMHTRLTHCQCCRYDNEWGYSQRVVDLAELAATKWE